MNCHDAATLVAAHADGETHGEERRAVDEHLRRCAACAAKHAGILALRARLRTELPRYAAPPALRARVLAAAHGSDGSRPPSRWPLPARWRLPGRWRPTERGRWAAGGALAGCAATLFAWLVGTAILDGRARDDIAVEAVTSHVRASQGNQSIQVASSDQHTVKPWLSAQLDYSPPVPDLRQEGYPLAGGRVDELEHRAIATLVYRFRNHTIDVFVRPASPRDSPMALRTVRGFNVAEASGGGMRWLAVSDVSPAVLTSFVQRLADEAAGP
jgi:anti-sigma factor RsiW